MARHALRKTNASLDLTGCLLSIDDLPRPWDAAGLYGRESPLEIEIGSGKGLFLASAAAARPERDFLGIEMMGKYAAYSAGRLVKAGFANARMVCGDALRVMAEVIPDDALAAVHIYFPDPWWKKKHHKRRVFKESLVRDVARTLRPGGSLHFWTDVEEYFRGSLELLSSEPRLVGPLPVDERPAEHDLDYRTHYERRTRLSGQPVYRSEFRKQEPRVERTP